MTENPQPPLSPEPEGDILKANTFGPDLIQVGMTVTGSDGDHIGKVKLVRPQEFLIDRPMARDLWAPYTSVWAVQGRGDTFRRGPVPSAEVVLEVKAIDVERQGWRHG
jgi:hypothetical protein